MASASERFTDAHIHFWDHSVPGLHWTWLDPGFDHPRLKGMHRLDAQRFTAAELRAEAGAASPTKIVHIQSATLGEDGGLEETSWLEALAASTGWPDAIVSASRLRAPDAPASIRANAAHPRFRGVRDMSVTGDVAPGAVAAAFETAAELGASVELQVAYEHYGTIRVLAEHWPAVTFVLGHAGQPIDRSGPYLRAWSRALAALAGSVPNVVVKVSAIASGLDPRWTVDSIRPWVLGCVEAFGADRSMLATNWPIDRLHGRYEELVAAYQTIASPLSAPERAALFHGTADRVYRI